MQAPELRPLSIGEILDVAIKIYLRNAWTLFRVVLFVVAPVEIVTALIDAGLRIDRLEEFPFLEWSADFLVEAEPGRYVLPEGPGELPLMFSLLASKPG